MLPAFLKEILVLVLLIGLHDKIPLIAQTYPVRDSMHFSVSRPANTAELIYSSLLKDSTSYLNGRVNTFRYTVARGHPFFGDGNWIKGSFVLNNRQYNNISLRYEILNDWLLCLHYTSDGPVIVEINSSLVKRFTLNDHFFINMDPAMTGMVAFEGGYYEELVYGRASLYLRWKKFISNPSANLQAEYDLQKTMFVLKNGELFRIANRKSILLALADKQDDIKMYFRQHRISVVHSTDQEIADVFRYYNSLF
jgi:hypothetical protein